MQNIENEDDGVRGHLFELLEGHLKTMRSDTPLDLGRLNARWEEFRSRASLGDLGHAELDGAIEELYHQMKKPPTG